MWVSWWLAIGSVGGSVASACESVAVDGVTVAPGTVLVLGERHGRTEDLGRARSVVEAAAAQGPVTIALEAVSSDYQNVLDALSKGEVRPGKVRRLVNWDDTWGYPFKPYKALFKIDGARYVAAGPKLGPKPADVTVPVPEAYEERLAGVAAAHHHGGGDPASVRKFAEAMAWRDYRIASLALDAWDGESALVVVAGRGHVEGGLGITWQFDEGLTEVAHQRVLLAPSRGCESGDLYFAD